MPPPRLSLNALTSPRSSSYRPSPLSPTQLIKVGGKATAFSPVVRPAARLTQEGTFVDESHSPLLSRWYGTVQAQFITLFKKFIRIVVMRSPCTVIVLCTLLSLSMGYFANFAPSVDERYFMNEGPVLMKYSKQRLKFERNGLPMTILYSAPTSTAWRHSIESVRTFEAWVRNQTVATPDHGVVSFQDVCFRFSGNTTFPLPPSPCAVESILTPPDLRLDPLGGGGGSNASASLAATRSALAAFDAGSNRSFATAGYPRLASLISSSSPHGSSSADGGDGATATATVFRSRFLLDFSLPATAAWESAVVERMRALPLFSAAGDDVTGVTADVLKGRELVEGLARGFQSDSALYGMSLVLMTVVAIAVEADCTSCGDSRMLVTGLGLLSSMFAVCLGFAFTNRILRIELNVLSLMVPFLVVAIGFDDTFVILSGIHHSHRNFRKDPDVHLLQSIGETCTALTMTSITDVTTFLVGSLSPMLCIRGFCLTAAVCIFFDYLLQVTFVVAVVFLDLKRSRGRRLDCCCCCCKTRSGRETVHHSAWKRLTVRWQLRVYNFFQRRVPGRALALLVAAALVGSIVAIPQLQVGEDGLEQVPGDPYVPFTTAMAAAFPADNHGSSHLLMTRPTLASLPQLRAKVQVLEAMPGVQSVDTRFLDDFSRFLSVASPALLSASANVTSAAALAHPFLPAPPDLAAAVAVASASPDALALYQRVAEAAATGGVRAAPRGNAPTPTHWYPEAWLNQGHDERAMSAMLLAFLRLPLFAHHTNTTVSLPLSPAAIWARQATDTVLRLPVHLVPLPDTQLRIQRMNQLSAADSHNMFVGGGLADTVLERTSVLYREMVKNMGLAALTVSLTLLLTMTPRAVLVCVGCIAMLDLLVFGAMFLAGLRVTNFTFVNVVFSIGFTVDYTVHMTHTFMEQIIGSPKRRMRDAVRTAGPPVFHGALTTVLGAVPLALGRTSTYASFGAMIIVCSSIGYLLSLLVIPAIMGRCGPKPNAQEEYVPGRGGMRGW